MSRRDVDPYPGLDGADRWRNHAMRGAFVMGYWACAHEGEPNSANPYDWRARGPSGRTTFAAAFARAWHEGWEAAEKDGLYKPGRGRDE
jgi:hypothetical protein